MHAFLAVDKEAIRHGVLVGVTLPGSPDPVPPSVLARLHPKERSFAETLRGYRQPEFVGGRLAAQQAIRLLGRKPVALLPDAEGAPVGAEDVSVSISHKRDYAVALAAHTENGTLGIDFETLARPRPGIETKVLTPRELERVQALPSERRWTAVIITFSIKEAIYKALAPRLHRYIDFSEAQVIADASGTAQVDLELAEGSGPTELEARFLWWRDGVLSTVRARW